MQVIDQAQYDDWKLKNSGDDYTLECFLFAERWAGAMERLMADGQTLEEVAGPTQRDTENGITGYMYNMGVQILALCWAHGEKLRRWHNLSVQLRDEGEQANAHGRILNTAILNVAYRGSD
jgi:hypothetical protein